MVSVVVPTFNRLPLLKHAISSVLAQSWQDFELLVVDDGSWDGTEDYVRGIPDPRVRYFWLAHSGNIARVRNAGALQGRGNWVAFLDSDDLWLPAKLTTQLARMDSGSWSYTRYDVIDESGRPKPMSGSWKELQGWIAEDVLSTTASVALCTVLMKRALFNNIGTFNEDPRLVYREDYHLLVRLALAAPVACVADVLALVRDHQNRSTAQLSTTQSFLRTAYVYQKLLPLLPTPESRRIARARRRLQAFAACKSAVRSGVSMVARPLTGRFD